MYRWSGDIGRISAFKTELIKASPDVKIVRRDRERLTFRKSGDESNLITTDIESTVYFLLLILDFLYDFSCRFMIQP